MVVALATGGVRMGRPGLFKFDNGHLMFTTESDVQPYHMGIGRLMLPLPVSDFAVGGSPGVHSARVSALAPITSRYVTPIMPRAAVHPGTLSLLLW